MYRHICMYILLCVCIVYIYIYIMCIVCVSMVNRARSARGVVLK